MKPQELTKSYTSYECSTGRGHSETGHRGVYTGSHGGEAIGLCCCGEEMAEEVKSGVRLRVEFETISPHIAAAMEERRGRDVWRNLNDSAWNALNWIPVTNEDDNENRIRAQYISLQAHADNHEQPIRNVRLLQSKQGEWELLQP
jgi:hypothetical protein